MYTISMKDLLVVFNDSPLATHTIRTRLHETPRKVAGVISQGIEKGIIRRVSPVEVGSGRYKVSVYAKC